MLPTKPKQNKMDSNVYEELKKDVQEIIDLIAGKQNKEANNKLVEVSENLDELLDHAEEDEELVETRPLYGIVKSATPKNQC
jgi:TRAP-type C4-dicarboxylate transport system substrate-binding protein